MERRIGLEAPTLPVLAVLALLTTVTLELVRVTAPLLQPAFDSGVPTAAGTALGTYLGAGVLGFALIRLTRGLESSRVLLVGVVLLAAARLIVQALAGDVRFVAGMATW